MSLLDIKISLICHDIHLEMKYTGNTIRLICTFKIYICCIFLWHRCYSLYLVLVSSIFSFINPLFLPATSRLSPQPFFSIEWFFFLSFRYEFFFLISNYRLTSPHFSFLLSSCLFLILLLILIPPHPFHHIFFPHAETVMCRCSNSMELLKRYCETLILYACTITHTLSFWLILWFTCWLTCWLTCSLTESPTDWVTDSPSMSLSLCASLLYFLFHPATVFHFPALYFT